MVVAVEDAGLLDSRYAISELLVGRTVSSLNLARTLSC